MADAYIQTPDDSGNTGKKLDTDSLTVGASTVHRERNRIAGAAAAELADVKATDPAGSEYGVITRNIPSGTQPVSAASLPLPSGASTSAKQDTGNTSLAAIDANAGATSDSAVTGDNAGTLSAKLRGLSKMLADVWDSVNHRVNVYIQNSTLAVTKSGTWLVDLISGQTGITGGAGSVAANTPRVTLASDDPAVASLAALDNIVGVAHDDPDSGAPVKIGGKAVSAEPSAVANGDRANFLTDLVGKQITLPYANPENFVSGAITTAMTGTTSTSLLAAPGSGLRNYITTIIVSNAHATVGTDVVIQDGSGGTTLLTIPASALYGGAVITLPTPLRQPTTNTALYCANVTTGASTKVSVVGYKGA